MKFSLYSLDRRLVEDWEVDEVYYPGPKGETGILPGHAPALSQITVGELRFLHATKKKTFNYAVSHGFIKVEGDHIVACSYTVESPQEIDVKRAVEAQKKAETRLKEPVTSSKEFRKHELKLQRAIIRQQVSKKKTQHKI